MSYAQLLTDLEALEEGLAAVWRRPTPPPESNVVHFARMELANTLARAREILEALANDEERRAQP